MNDQPFCYQTGYNRHSPFCHSCDQRTPCSAPKEAPPPEPAPETETVEACSPERSDSILCASASSMARDADLPPLNLTPPTPYTDLDNEFDFVRATLLNYVWSYTLRAMALPREKREPTLRRQAQLSEYYWPIIGTPPAESLDDALNEMGTDLDDICANIVADNGRLPEWRIGVQFKGPAEWREIPPDETTIRDYWNDVFCNDFSILSAAILPGNGEIAEASLAIPHLSPQASLATVKASIPPEVLVQVADYEPLPVSNPMEAPPPPPQEDAGPTPSTDSPPLPMEEEPAPTTAPQTFDCTVDSKALTAALKHAKRLIGKTSPTVLSFIHLEAAEGELRFSYTDYDVTVRQQIEASVTAAGSLLVQPASILSALTTKGQTRLYLDPNSQRLAIQSGATSASTETAPVEDFPVLPAPRPSQSFPCNASLLPALERLVPFASTDRARLSLTGIYIESHPDHGVLARATDGSMAGHETVVVKTTNTWSRLIPATGIIATLRLSDTTTSTVHLALAEDNGPFVIFSGPKWSVTVRCLDETFPDLERFKPGTPKWGFIADRKTLITAVAPHSKGKQQEHSVTLKAASNSGLEIATHGYSKLPAETAVPVTWFGQPLPAPSEEHEGPQWCGSAGTAADEILLNAALLATLLDSLATEKCRVILPEGGSGVVHIVSPDSTTQQWRVLALLTR